MDPYNSIWGIKAGGFAASLRPVTFQMLSEKNKIKAISEKDWLTKINVQINIKFLIKIKCQESMEFYISTTKRDSEKPSFKIIREIRKF